MNPESKWQKIGNRALASIMIVAALIAVSLWAVASCIEKYVRKIWAQM